MRDLERAVPSGSESSWTERKIIDRVIDLETETKTLPEITI